MKILFLDDDEQRHEYARKALVGHEVRHVRTAAEALTALAVHEFDLAMLDHDLGGEHYAPSNEVSGYEVARRLAAKEIPAPRYVQVHSYNAPAAQRMVSVLAGAGIGCHWAPFGPGSFAFQG